jgi:hypothetical protein
VSANINRPGVAGLRRFDVRASQPQLATEEVVRRVSARVDPLALGAALGIVIAAMTFVATAILVMKGGPAAGIHLSLLSNYWPGYDVSLGGAVIGALYGGACGFAFAVLTAALRNALQTAYLGGIRLWANMSRTYFLDRLE